MIGMYFLITEGVTFIIENIVDIAENKKETIELGNKGYKIDENYTEVWKKYILSDPNYRIKRSLIAIIPFVNIYYSKKYGLKKRKKFDEDAISNGLLKPMTTYEKSRFDKLESNHKKFIYMATSCKFTSIDEIIEHEGIDFNSFMTDDFEFKKKDNSNKDKLKELKSSGKIVNMSLDYREIPPLKYTLDDVKKFNFVNDNDYILGIVDERNIAIINVPTDSTSIESVILNDGKVHKFTKIDEEEAKDKNFVIYPYNIDFDKDDNLKRVYEAIKKEKHPDDRESSVITPRLISYDHKPLTKNMTMNNK